MLVSRLAPLKCMKDGRFRIGNEDERDEYEQLIHRVARSIKKRKYSGSWPLRNTHIKKLDVRQDTYKIALYKQFFG